MLVLSRKRDESIEIGVDKVIARIVDAVADKVFRMAGEKCGLAEIKEQLAGVLPQYGPVKVVIVEIRGDKVRLGIDASTDIPVHRKEVADDIRRKELDSRQIG